MYNSFSVKCGRCGTMLETEISWPDKKIDSDAKQRKVACPRCHFSTTYDPKNVPLR